MKNSDQGAGGSFSVDGGAAEIDLAEFGWDPEERARVLGDRAEKPEDFGEEPGRGMITENDDDGSVRLQKALAHAGIASRRACETLITSGRVWVNGKPERELGSRIVPGTDEVRVDGVVVQLDATKRYFVLNKPTGVVSTMSDEHDRPDLREFTDQFEDRLYNVGRLDTDTSGLLILTNDGELAHRLAHPSFGVQKTYVAKVRGQVTPAVIQQLKDGVELKDGLIKADRAKLLPGGAGKSHSLVELTLHSGKNRIVRRMLAEVGHPVDELVRRQFGPLHLGTLRVGEMRELAPAERGALLSAGPDDWQSDDAEQEKKKPRSRVGWAKSSVTAGRPGDGKGAKGMRGVAARGNPHGRRAADAERGGERRGGDRDREQRGGREQRDNRGFDRNRDDRGGRGFDRDRDQRGGRDQRDNRGYDRNRDERGGRGFDRDRDQRGGRDQRDNRGFDRDRDQRGGREQRDNRGFDRNRDDRGGRGFDRDRDQRGGRDQRDNRGYDRNRDDRGGRDQRDNRGYDRNRDDRGYDRNRDDRGGRDQRGGGPRGYRGQR